MADSQARRPPQLELPFGRVAQWRLRELMATKGLFSAVQLQQALGEQGVKIGPSQAHELMTRAPRQPRMEVLFALCQLLECAWGTCGCCANRRRRRPPTRSPLVPEGGSHTSSRSRPGWTRGGLPDPPDLGHP